MKLSSAYCCLLLGEKEKNDHQSCYYFCPCPPFINLVDSLFSISYPLHTRSSPPSSTIYPKGLLFTTDKNWKGILHIKADPSAPLQIYLIKRWLLQLQWVALEAYHLKDKRGGDICMRWKSTLNFLMAEMNVYSVTATERGRRLWVWTGCSAAVKHWNKWWQELKAKVSNV